MCVCSQAVCVVVCGVCTSKSTWCFNRNHGIDKLSWKWFRWPPHLTAWLERHFEFRREQGSHREGMDYIMLILWWWSWIGPHSIHWCRNTRKWLMPGDDVYECSNNKCWKITWSMNCWGLNQMSRAESSSFTVRIGLWYHGYWPHRMSVKGS